MSFPELRPVPLCIEAIVEELSKCGIHTSFVFGTRGSVDVGWSVDVLTRDGQTFERPYAAESLTHAVAIAFIECQKRGWA